MAKGSLESVLREFLVVNEIGNSDRERDSLAPALAQLLKQAILERPRSFAESGVSPPDASLLAVWRPKILAES